MECPQCRWENPTDANVCSSCGSGFYSAAKPQPHMGGTGNTPPTAKVGEAIAAEAVLAREIRRKRAYSSSVDLTGASPYITQPSAGRQSVHQVERQMGMLVGGVFIVVLTLGALVIYLNVPKEEEPYYGSPLTAMIEHLLNKPVRTVSAETWTGKEIGAAMLYDTSAPTKLSEVNAALANKPSAAGKREDGEPEPVVAKKQPRPKKVEPVQEVKAEAPVHEHTLRPPEPVQVATAAPVEIAAPPPPRKDDPVANKVAVVDRSITSETPRKRSKAGCTVEEDNNGCEHRYIVTFKRTWGPILEERAYSSREMSLRAQELWHREGKILEPDGEINDTYEVKPKTFTPIPGHSV